MRVLLELTMLFWSWDSVLKLVRLVDAMELMEELRTCGFAMEPRVWPSKMLCGYKCTPLESSVFTAVLGLVGGAAVEVFSRVCCGGISGALELGKALASSSFVSMLELQLVSGLCKLDNMEPAAFVSHALCPCRMVLGWWCWLRGLCVEEMALWWGGSCCCDFWGFTVVGLRV